MKHELESSAHEFIDAHAIGKALQILQDEVKKKADLATARPFVTVSREFGCEGTELAIELTQALNEKAGKGDGGDWMYYDKALLDRIAEDNNLKKEIIQAAERRSRGIVEQYLSKMLADKPDDYDVFQYVVSAMTTLARRGHVVLVGRGASIVTQALEGGVHIRVYSGEAFKIHRMKDRMPEISDRPGEVAAAIEKEGRKRDSFVERHLTVSPRDPRFYHLLLNNDKFTAKEMSASVICLLESRRISAS